MALLNVQLLAISLLAFVFYLAIGIIYRLYFSPIAHFPGRKIAAATFWYEIYWDFFRNGQYTYEIEKMHEKYGPIVRINPYELHIKDSEFYTTIYPYAAAGKRVDKWAWQARTFGETKSVFNTISHDLHRSRRNAINSFFSKRAVTELEPSIRHHVDKAVARLRNIRNTKTPVNLIDLFACLTGDIISDYAYSKSYGFLDAEDLHPEWQACMANVQRLGTIVKPLPWLLTMMKALPDWLLVKLRPGMQPFVNMLDDARKQIAALRDKKQDKEKTSHHRSIFEELIEGDVPEEEKSIERLVDESQTVIGAGTTTTAQVLAITAFHVINNPSTLKKLREDLQQFNSTTSAAPRWQDLEQLPYFAGIVKEGLRVAYGVTGRLPRIFPEDSLKYGEWTIPAKTVVSMSAYFMHNDPMIFPDAESFKPERWLVSDGARLDNYLTPFGKGTRQCVGLNLAYAELYLTLAAVFAPGQFELELFETDYTDVQMRHDFLVPLPRLDSKGIRVIVK